MSNTQAIAILVGALMPFVISILKQAKLSKLWNQVITILACAVAGTATVWATGGFDNIKWASLVGIIAVVYVASQAAYAAWFKNTPTEETLNQITSF